jgi:spoIIIJ-associated protein
MSTNAKELLDTMLGYLGFVVQIEETRSEGGNPTLQIYTEESRRLIGRDGETLEAIQFLLNRLLQAKDKNAPKVIVDCEMYRSMREDKIVQHVKQLAERVRISGRSLQLEPMISYERRIVHNAFKDVPEVASWSPSDSARIKQITLLRRQPKKNPAPQESATKEYRRTEGDSVAQFEDHFSIAFILRSSPDGCRKIFQRIRFFHFRAEQSTLCHLEERSKSV